MSVMAKLAGVECAPCRRPGHPCQAQMIDGEPMCLRCADGELCAFVTAETVFETPRRFIEGDDHQVFEIPLLGRIFKRPTAA